jgi:hypothetical protein
MRPQQPPLGAPLYDSGPPVQAFVESAEDTWRPLGRPPSPSAALPAESPGESTQQWTPAEELGGPPEPASMPPSAPTPLSAPPPVPLSASPHPPTPPENAGGLPPTIDPASVVPGHDLVLPSAPNTPEPTERTVPQPPFTAPPAHQPQPQPPPMPQAAPAPAAAQEPGTSESVAERTMAMWLSDSPAAPPGAPDEPPIDTPVYGTMAPPPPHGYGGNETALLPGMPPGGPQPGAWQNETWQNETWQGESWHPAAWQQPPGHDDPPERPTGNAGKPLIIAVLGLVVVALVAAGVVLWPDGGDNTPAAASSAGPSAAAANSPATTKSNTTGRREAVALNRVLNASATSRGALARALAASGTCRRLPTAIVGFQRVAIQRRAQLAHTRALKVGHLANGARLRQTLARSIQLSLAVDQALLTWARSRQGCRGRPRPDANYQRARGPLSAQASATKAQFATLWAPVARQHRLPSRTANSF